jgi:hypothetical protein
MDMNDRNLMSGPVGGYQSLKEFFAKNLKVIYYVIPELRDLNNLSRNNIMQLTKYMSLYPSVISEKIFNAFNEYIPKEIHKGLSRMMEDPSSENVESIMTKIFGKNPLKSVWREVVIDESALDNELTDVVRMTYRGGFFETDNMPEDEFIEESISDVLEKSLKNPQDDLTQLIRSMTPLIKNDFDLNYLSMLLGKEKYENLINEVGYRYSEKENNSYRIQQEGIVSKIREIVSVPYQDGIEFENSDYFFGLLKGFMVSEVYEEGETLDFNDFISEIFSMNDIPLSITDFYETIYENAYQNFNIEEFKDDVHHEIYSALDYKFNEMKEEGITPNQLSKLYNILKDLNFNPSTNEIDNEIANIKVFPETSDIKKETVKIQFTNKQNPDESYTGTVSYDDIAKYATNYQLFENIIRIRKLIMG